MKRLAPIALAFALTGCMATPQALPAETETITATVTETVSRPAVVVTETVEVPAPVPEDTPMDWDDDAELAMLAMEMSWGEQTAAYQADICDGWASASQDERMYMVTAFVDGFESDPDGLLTAPSAEQVEGFFNEKCL